MHEALPGFLKLIAQLRPFVIEIEREVAEYTDVQHLSPLPAHRSWLNITAVLLHAC
jgi:hypothetical protein